MRGFVRTVLPTLSLIAAAFVVGWAGQAHRVQSLEQANAACAKNFTDTERTNARALSVARDALAQRDSVIVHLWKVQR